MDLCQLLTKQLPLDVYINVKGEQRLARRLGSAKTNRTDRVMGRTFPPFRSKWVSELTLALPGGSVS